MLKLTILTALLIFLSFPAKAFAEEKLPWNGKEISGWV